MGVKYNSSPVNSDGLAFCLDFSNPGCYENANTEVELLPAHDGPTAGFSTDQTANDYAWTGIAFSVDEIDTDGRPIVFARSIDNRTKRIYGQEDTTYWTAPQLTGVDSGNVLYIFDFEGLENGPGWSERYIQLNASGKKVRIAKWDVAVESLDDLLQHEPIGVSFNNENPQPIKAVKGYGRITELLGNVDLVGGYTIGQEGDNGTYTPFGETDPVTRQPGPSLHGTYGLGNPIETIESLHTPTNWYSNFSEQGRPRPWVYALFPSNGSVRHERARLGASITDISSTNTISGLADDNFMLDGIMKAGHHWRRDWNQDPNLGFGTYIGSGGSGRANKDSWPGTWDDIESSSDVDGNGTSDRTIWQHGPMIEMNDYGGTDQFGCIRAVAGYWYDNWPTNTRFGNLSFLESRNFPIPPTPREEFKRLPLTKFCSKKVTALAPATGPTVSSGQIRYSSAFPDLDDLNLGSSTSGLNPDDFPVLLAEEEDGDTSIPIAIWVFHVKTGYMAKWHVKNSQLTGGEDPGRNHRTDDLITGDEYEVFMYRDVDAEDITHPVISRGGVPAFKHFNGTNHRMWIDTLKYGNNDKRIDEATIAAWVRTDFDDGSGNTWNSNNWAILDFDRSEVFTFALTGSGFLSFSARTSNNGGIGGTYHDIVGNTRVNDGYWHHICVTRSTANQRIRMYIDGKLDREFLANGNLGYMGRGSTRYGIIGDGSEKGSPGDTTPGNNIYYEGDISAIWLYDEKEMSESEVYDFYMGTAPKFGRLE